MYEELTKYIPVLKECYFGKCHEKIISESIQISKIAFDILDDLAFFIENHREYRDIRYSDVLNAQGYECKGLEDVDVSNLDDKSLVALIDGAYQLNRFSDGYVLDLYKNGIILKWLERLKQIDE